MRIYAVSTMFNGNEMIRQLRAQGIAITGVIGLDEAVSTEGISGYENPRAICEREGMEFIPLQSYGMHSDADKALLAATDIDVALVLGWQRLVPDWFLQQCRKGAIGVHGSADGITGGRGRSPQNWALILGKTDFHLSIFFADPGVDSGPVIDSTSIPLSPWDDIRSSHLKIGRATVNMLVRNFANGNIANHICQPQKGDVRYLPQRKPEDGEIDWRRSAQEIYNFVRALTHPYPGAFSAMGEGQIFFWRVRPFVEQALPEAPAGTIIDIFEQGELLIATGKGAVMVDEYGLSDGAQKPVRGMRLPSVDFMQQMRGIAQRHKSRYPDMPLIQQLEDVL
jgi:methionyl-tRNA formyltransferase